MRFWMVYGWYQFQLLFMKDAPRMRAQKRVHLRSLLLQSERYEMASQEIRGDIERAHSTKKFGLEFKLRLDLARCFLKMEQKEEAALEQQRAWDCLKTLILSKQFEQAERSYEHAIKMFDASARMKAKLALHAATAYDNLKDWENSLRWAQRAIEYSNAESNADDKDDTNNKDKDDKVSFFAPMIAAISLNNLQRAAEAEPFVLRAVKAAEHSDNPQRKAVVWAQLAATRAKMDKRDQAQEDARTALGFDANNAQANAVWCNGLVAEGREEVKQQRYNAACELFERARALPMWDDPKQALFHVQVLVYLSHAHSEAGRPAQCVRCAEEAVSLKPTGKLRFSARTMAAVGYDSQGQLDKALAHRQLAFDLALIEGDNVQIASQTVGLAIDRYQRGRLDESYAMCERALQLDASSTLALAQQTDIRRLQGRTDEARRLALHKLEFLLDNAIKNFLYALGELNLAYLEAEAGNATLAWQYLQGARAFFAADTKHAANCEVAAAWILALLGQREDAYRVLEHLEEIAARFPDNRVTQTSCCTTGGRAALVLGDHNRALELWQRYITLVPIPVHEPTAFWGLGESYLGLGRCAEAIEAFSRAANVNFETHYTQAARERLKELQEQQ